jgi:hypothetical protein
MLKVNTNFLIYRWIEIGAFIAGITIILLFRNQPGKTFWTGLGITLTIMASVLFIADFIAEKRAFHYTLKLEEFNQKA